MSEMDISKRIIALEKEIESLPKGSIVQKCVNDKNYYYHRYNEKGKKLKNMLIINMKEFSVFKLKSYMILFTQVFQIEY